MIPVDVFIRKIQLGKVRGQALLCIDPPHERPRAEDYCWNQIWMGLTWPPNIQITPNIASAVNRAVSNKLGEIAVWRYGSPSSW